MAYGNNSVHRLSPAALRVDPAAYPGSITGAERTPAVGEQVYCTAGPAEVVRVLGKTSNGSRLLELRLADLKLRPFFAAASNVLVAPEAP
ncbi:MAG: hypothetical protein HY703_03280 [Gemmatimonadetes bacterium]|nr:hypothetical protein [Gemmatimonadota bacterium]